MTTLLIITLIILGLTALYLLVLRPWQLKWGATAIEIKRLMPGDEIVAKPTFDATRGLTINAIAENIYPWIIQMGVTRAGWYSYDFLDNLAKRSAEVILPEHQNIQIGDVIPLSPDGKQGMLVKDFKKNEWMLWWDKKGDTTWVCSSKYRFFSAAILFNLLIEFFDIWMMRKCMLGIKKRAEKLHL
ncbi:hypothetical protein BH10PSE19_BH10PSE19_19030 [soil metagenome]